MILRLVGRAIRQRAVGAWLSAVVIAAGGCGAATGTPPASTSASPAATEPGAGPAESAPVVSDLEKAAIAEGHLTTIGLPHDWCNYGEALKTFSERYPIEITELTPDIGFAEALDAIRTKRNAADAPDVIDVSRPIAAKAKTDKLVAPYKVATWDDIPASVKDAGGFWYGDYYGVLAFETNASLVTDPPHDWKDLLGPTHRRQVALAGDPRVNEQAIQTVYAAALADGGSLDKPQAGLNFFVKLQTAGNLLPGIASQVTIDRGDTPITIRWTTSALPHREAAADQPKIDVSVPTTGRLGTVYAQAISAFAPHPNAARLWMEFLYSDEGQNLWLKGSCQPVRFDAMSAANAIPVEVLAKTPDTAGTVFPSLAQLDAATRVIATSWDAVVKVDIK